MKTPKKPLSKRQARKKSGDFHPIIGEVRGTGITTNVNSRCLFSNASDGTLKLVARTGTNIGLTSNLKALYEELKAALTDIFAGDGCFEMTDSQATRTS